MEALTPTDYGRSLADDAHTRRLPHIVEPMRRSMTEEEEAALATIENMHLLNSGAEQGTTMSETARQDHIPFSSIPTFVQDPSRALSVHNVHDRERLQNSYSLERSQRSPSLERFPQKFIDPRLCSYTSTPAPDTTSKHSGSLGTPIASRIPFHRSFPSTSQPPRLPTPFQQHESDDVGFH